MLCARSKGTITCICFDFFSRLTNIGIDATIKYGKKIPNSFKGMTLIPMHVGGNHWALAQVDMDGLVIRYLDSALGKSKDAYDAGICRLQVLYE